MSSIDIPVRPTLNVFLRGFENQINKGFAQSICWKRRRVIINGPEPISSKSMLVKSAMASKLQTEKKFPSLCNLECDDNINNNQKFWKAT